ncbi:sensor histidine kinase [Cellulomonas xylanilytica]|uniref:histidine kinase n=1 Tax=Cellulomonas xylanilytica TaxID=233583 RepID=A0A510VBB8_9CELL|nr:HAMP domain-containing sensor histidine kinase [Cellulomonas xylanilytica]GEK22445.1 two-component sensor histidine kinase [Cellulomonas xylanilytica]
MGTRPRWTMRRRLVVMVVALVAVVATVMGTVSTLALQRSLTDQLDEKLTAAHRRTVDGPELSRASDPGEMTDMPQDGPYRPGKDAGTVVVELPDGVDPTGLTVDQAYYIGDDGTAVALDDDQVVDLLAVPVDDRPVTVAVSGLGRMRAIAGATPVGTTVTALPTTSVTSTVTAFVAVEVVVAALALLVAAAAGIVLVRRELRPLDRVVGTANRVSRLPLDRGEVVLADRVPARDTDPATEVGQVGAALNRLLGHVEQALGARHESESQVRRFVADASHELRTPLASIRGYAELVRRSPDDLPASALQAMSRVESESQRMTALLEDMLLLARLDAGRPLASEPVDLSLLAVDAVTDAHAAGPDHDWRLDLAAPDDDGSEDALVVGDDHRLRQVLANLLSNARLHTPAGTAVTVRVRRAGDQVVLQVADDGPGIPPALRESLFQRFTRGDPSRNSATGSTGLGLAIVHAVVTAHGGTITVTSGPGTTFTVTLPAAPG